MLAVVALAVVVVIIVAAAAVLDDTRYRLLFPVRLLDEFGHEMDNTGTRMDATMKKIAKVTRMSNGELVHLLL